jgi:PAS domain S-box-containing protein
MDENINNGHYRIPTFLNSTTKIVASTAILYFLIAKLSLFIFVTKINILPFFPAMGFAIAAVLLLGRKVIFGVAVGCLLFSISLYKNDFQNATTFEELIKPLALCIVRPIIATINVFLVSYLSQLWCKKKYPFDSEKNVIFFAFACFLGAFISVSIGFITLTMTPYFSLDNCILIWSNMLRGNALGSILFTPFVLSWLYDTKEFTEWLLVKKVEAFFLFISTLSLSLYIFESHANNESVLFFLLIWAACRFGMKIITLVAMIITVIAIYCTGHHMGGFIFSGWNNDFLMLQLFLFVNMVSVLFLKAILNQKENEENKLKISKQDLGLEKNILKATIESSNGISIFSIDTNLNYLSFNSAHERYMKNVQGVDIKIGSNYNELFSDIVQKEEITERLRNVLNGKIYSIEEKDATGKYWNIAVSSIKNEEDKIIGATTIVTNVTELKLKEIQLERNNISLNERIKELRCLYDISEIISNKTLSKSEKLEACVQIIPKALQFPEIANCRIQFREKEFISDNYQENDWQLNQKIVINGEECGSIKVGYFNAEKLKKETVFLDEEVKLLETLTDIISKSFETKITEEKLLKSEETYRVLFDNVQDVFFKTSIRTGEILDVSPSCITFNGIKREELIGQSMSIIYSDKDQMQLMFQKIISEQKVIDHNNEITIKGKLFYVSINAKVILDSNGDPEFAVGSLRDINERRLIEEKLKISEAKFRSIFENFEDVYFRTTMDGTVLDVSPSFEKHFLKPCSFALDNSVFNFYYDEQDRESLLKKLKEDGQVRDCDIRFRDENENIVFFSVNARLIYDENGEPIYIEKSMRNVNDRVAFQKEMMAKNRQLEFQNTELEQFAYIASHDLQEPLITVIHCIQMLQEELNENLDEDQKQYLQFINSSTARMQLLVKGLLDYSRIGKERKTNSINCNEIIANVLADMNVSLKESKAIIEYENLPVIEGYTTEVRQLFQNMISNANKYQRKGQQPKIKIAAVKEENNWLFSIQDNGIGIEEQDKDKVFVIFKRLHNRNEYQGTGIGLSHCKKIVEHHNGKIWVESKYNEGSTFKWTFPIELN